MLLPAYSSHKVRSVFVIDDITYYFHDVCGFQKLVVRLSQDNMGRDDGTDKH